jgi:sigma-B regulation protein RsbU (phosphoserine phosphatase)
MQSSSRLIYFLSALALTCEALLLIIDIALFYAQQALMLSSEPYILKDVLATVAFAALYLIIRNRIKHSAAPDSQIWIEPVSACWQGFVSLGLLALAMVLTNWIAPKSNYDIMPSTEVLRPQSLQAVFKTHLVTIFLGAVLLAALVVLERLILFRRTKNTQSNFLAMIALLLVKDMAELGNLPGESTDGLLSMIVSLLAVVMVLVNAFRLSWVLPLSRDDKIRALFLVLGMVGELIMLGLSSAAEHLEAYSSVVGSFLISIAGFLALYLLTTFFSLLAYLPTSEALERKTSEVRNLYAMSRFAAEVFDEEKIYSSLVSYACGVAGKSACGWFDIYQPFDAKTVDANTAGRLPNLQWKTSKGFFKTVVRQNISEKNLHEFAEKASFIWEEMSRNPRQVRIDDVATDRRIVKEKVPLGLWTRRLRRRRSAEEEKIVSTLSVPLISRANLIGVLTVAKDVEYGFIKDDIELITTFADQAAIAVQNSRLIREVIDKERMQQELAVAQKIQLRLLPSAPLAVQGYEMDSVSYPAFEVGGDFYDYMLLEQKNSHASKFGVMIADVSGKGTSAAFYMAELKGIFQSLCRLYPNSPTELLKHANETLSRSLDKKSFVSALYAIFDTERHTMQISNAGHCPMVHLTENGAEIVKLRGLALGLDKGQTFNKVIGEEERALRPGDVVVFYTDGLIEAVNASDEQFGLERLLQVLSQMRQQSATEIKKALFEAVNAFAGEQGSIKDDLTILVVKRCATGA